MGGLVVADGLYLRADPFHFVTRRSKEALVVLKDERRDLTRDARGLFDGPPHLFFRRGQTECECWDLEVFTSWPGLDSSARVVQGIPTAPWLRFPSAFPLPRGPCEFPSR